jgi:hypothetical protein
VTKWVRKGIQIGNRNYRPLRIVRVDRPTILSYFRLVMKPAILLAMFLGAMASAFGGEIVITSPDHPRTFVYGEMISHQLYVDPTTDVLTARITFSNLPYVSDREPRVDESFDFRFPGLHTDRMNHRLLARAHHGEQIAVARIQGDSACGSVDLAAGAKIYLLKESGRVTAILTATDHTRSGLRWIQMDDNWSLQNLLVNFFGPLRASRG